MKWFGYPGPPGFDADFRSFSPRVPRRDVGIYHFGMRGLVRIKPSFTLHSYQVLYQLLNPVKSTAAVPAARKNQNYLILAHCGLIGHRGRECHEDVFRDDTPYVCRFVVILEFSVCRIGT